MSVFDYIINSLGIEMAILMQMYSYSKISNKPFKIDSISKIITIILTIIIFSINIYYNYIFSKLIISLILTIVSNYAIFREELIKCVMKSSIYFILISIIDLAVSAIILLTPFINMVQFDSSSIFKFVYSFIVYIIVFIIMSINKLRVFTDKIMKKAPIIGTILLIIILLSLMLIIYKNVIILKDKEMYVVNIILLLCFGAIIALVIFNNYKNELLKEKQNILLDFITNYEILIDKHRKKTHEIHNDLLILKSIENKDNNKYNYEIDNLINKYSKSTNTYKNMHKLPKGLKGVLHFKIYDIKNKKIKLEMEISSKVMKPLENSIKNDYVDVAKVLSILLDNAIEASEKSKQKEIFIDFIDKKDEMLIYIENTYKGNIDMNKIYNEKYSSKGKGRGFGLSILKNIIDKKTNLELKQYVNNDRFVSELTIKRN